MNNLCKVSHLVRFLICKNWFNLAFGGLRKKNSLTMIRDLGTKNGWKVEK